MRGIDWPRIVPALRLRAAAYANADAALHIAFLGNNIRRLASRSPAVTHAH